MTSAPPSLAASMEHLDVTENRPTEGEVTPVPKKRGMEINLFSNL